MYRYIHFEKILWLWKVNGDIRKSSFVCSSYKHLFRKASTLQHPSKHSSWWRRLQDVLTKTNMFALALHLQNTSSRRLGQDQNIRLAHTSSRRLARTFSRRLKDVFQKRLQDIFKTPSRRLQDVFKKSWKTSSRHLQEVFKTFWRRLQDVLQRYLQGIFKTYHQVKLFLLTRLWEAFNTFLRRSFPKTIIYRGICPGNTTSVKFMVSIQNLQER